NRVRQPARALVAVAEDPLVLLLGRRSTEHRVAVVVPLDDEESIVEFLREGHSEPGELPRGDLSPECRHVTGRPSLEHQGARRAPSSTLARVADDDVLLARYRLVPDPDSGHLGLAVPHLSD